MREQLRLLPNGVWMREMPFDDKSARRNWRKPAARRLGAERAVKFY